MKMETLRATTTETFVDGGDITVTVNPWANLEGVSFMVHGKDLAMRCASSLRWEELDVLLVALTASRAN